MTVSRSSYVFSSQGSHLSELVNASRMVEAERLYFEQSAYFADAKNRASVQEELGRLARFILGQSGEGLTESVNAVQALQVSSDPEEWARQKPILADARERLNDYPDHPLVQLDEHRPPEFETLREQLARLDGAYAGNAGATLDRLGLGQLGVLVETYPVELDVAGMVAARSSAVEALLAAGSAADLRGFAIGARDALPEPTMARVAQALRAKLEAEMAASGKSPFARQLAIADALGAVGMDPAEAGGLTVGFANATSRFLLDKGQIDFAPEIEVDIPTEVQVINSVEGVFDPGAPRFSFVVQVLMARATRDVSSMTPTRSRVLAGYRSEPNPDYKVAVLNMNTAMMNLQSAQLNQATSRGGYGLAAAFAQLAAGVAVAAAIQEYEDAVAAVGNTPEYIDVPVYQPYAFQLADVKAQKTASVNYFVIDREARQFFKGTFDTVENRRFSVAYGVAEEDPDRTTHLANADTERVVADWEKAPVTVPLSDLVQHYLANEAAWKRASSADTVLKAMSADASVAIARAKAETPTTRSLDDPRFDTVVVVRNSKGTGTGFYILPDVVMTNYHVVEEQEFITINKYDGTESFGRVIAKDIRQDLAIIRVQSRGQPVRLYDGPDLRPGQDVDVIGHPRGLEYTITRGIISAVRPRPSLMGVGGEPVMFVQVDASINPGNSGGPVFLGDDVIAVSDFIVRDSPGLNFAIHIGEVREFLRRHLPEMGS